MSNHIFGIETGFSDPHLCFVFSVGLSQGIISKEFLIMILFSFVSLNIDFDMIIQKISRLEFFELRLHDFVFYQMLVSHACSFKETLESMQILEMSLYSERVDV